MSAPSADKAVTRHFVDVGDRVVHYRMAGRGFPVLLLHQSPRSSADMLGLMARWSKDMLCIAPDTPGFGASDALTGPVPLERLARETLAFARALGLERFGLYGVHTGAIVAVQAGVLAPDRVAAVAAHGYGAWTPEERALFGARYAPPFRPQPSGAHLAWLWTRVSDQRQIGRAHV
jgi:pimeloyl-ACP methyl ester carboxylesterase